ncbi:MAG: Ldh family oxidoreductase, partial [Bacteroidia bacterium]
MNLNYQTIPTRDLRQFAITVFKYIGCNETDSNLASDVLLKADLRGIDSHGVARLSGYIRLWEKG